MNAKPAVSRFANIGHRERDHVPQLSLEILPQPDKTTCGPTCLHAVYRYLGRDLELVEVIDDVVSLESGGTLAVLLGQDALARGFRARIHTTNIRVFDPSWFRGELDLAERLALQAGYRSDPKLRNASLAYRDFVLAGGEIRFEHPTAEMIFRYHERGVPIITGLSATYLYGEPRERDDKPDDTRGEPAGHFVVLAGSDPEHKRVLVADPLKDEPGNKSHYYWVDADRLLASILLGVLTYDASVLVVESENPEWPR
jgi:hypothetical protein